MAKKITLEEYKKINETNQKKEKNPLLLPLEIFIILFGCSLVAVVLILLNNDKAIKAKNKKIEDLKSKISYQQEIDGFCNQELNKLKGNKTTNYIKNKLDFIDNNIVFRIEGFGNYYYSYDCMVQKVNGTYTYWAYNKEKAAYEGLRPGGC